MSTSSIPMVNLRLSMTKLNKLSPATPRRNKNRESGRRLTKASPPTPTHEVDLSDDTSEEHIPWCEMHCRRSYKLACCAVFLILAIITIIVVVVYYRTHQSQPLDQKPDTVGRKNRYPYGSAPPSWTPVTLANTPNTDNDPKLRNFGSDQTSPVDIFPELSSSGLGNATEASILSGESTSSVDSLVSEENYSLRMHHTLYPRVGQDSNATTPADASHLSDLAEEREMSPEETIKVSLDEILVSGAENETAAHGNWSSWADSGQLPTALDTAASAVNETTVNSDKTNNSAKFHHKLYSGIHEPGQRNASGAAHGTKSDNSIHFNPTLPQYEATPSGDQKQTTSYPITANMTEISPSLAVNMSLNRTEEPGENQSLTTAHHPEQNTSFDLNSTVNEKLGVNCSAILDLGDDSPIFIQNLYSKRDCYETARSLRQNFTHFNLTEVDSGKNPRAFNPNSSDSNSTITQFPGAQTSEPYLFRGDFHDILDLLGSGATSRPNSKVSRNFTQTQTNVHNKDENSTSLVFGSDVDVNSTDPKSVDLRASRLNPGEGSETLDRSLTNDNLANQSSTSKSFENPLASDINWDAVPENSSYLNVVIMDVNAKIKSRSYKPKSTDLSTFDENVGENAKNLAVHKSSQTFDFSENFSKTSIERTTSSNMDFTSNHDNATNFRKDQTVRVLDNKTTNLTLASSTSSGFRGESRTIFTTVSTSTLPSVVNDTINSSASTKATARFAPTDGDAIGSVV